MHLIALACWLARKAVTAEWKAQGRKPEFSEIAEATNVYFMEHGKELMKEAWEHPIAQEYRHKDQMRLAQESGDS
jgi:hypothetical protein